MTLTLLLLACAGTGTVSLGDKADDTGAPTTDDTGGPTDDSGDTGDTQPQGHPHAGSYEGMVAWEIPEWDWLVCEADLTLEVNDDGELSGGTICEYDADDGNIYELPVEVEGGVSEDGQVVAEIVFETWDSPGRGWEINEYDAELDGEIDRGDLEAEFTTEIDMGRDGDYELWGWVELELE